ncbi:MAG: radical SAM protein, partial [Eggerthellaceae bacterium]|nr:radical SAM protein [Eggerthellaceae bacterium]
MRYVLNKRYRFRGWQKARTGLFDRTHKRATFLEKEKYQLLLQCDGAHDLDLAKLPEEHRSFLEEQLEKDIVHPAEPMEYLLPEQEYMVYPCEYKEEIQWSITGACNLECRHCFMSAPHAKHGSPSHGQIIQIADQLAECGIFQVGLTGGEPLIREDLLDIIDALNEREIGIS